MTFFCEKVHRELSTFLGVFCGLVESTSNNLRLRKEAMEDEVESMEAAVASANGLVTQAQDIQARLLGILKTTVTDDKAKSMSCAELPP